MSNRRKRRSDTSKYAKRCSNSSNVARWTPAGSSPFSPNSGIILDSSFRQVPIVSITHRNTMQKQTADTSSMDATYDDALASVRQAIGQFVGCSAEERATLQRDLDQLYAMAEK